MEPKFIVAYSLILIAFIACLFLIYYVSLRMVLQEDSQSLVQVDNESKEKYPPSPYRRHFLKNRAYHVDVENPKIIYLHIDRELPKQESR
ncbi:hypothetical protein CN918_31700 [Priestia megaterium]|nr:hypothetical protein CN918_31700 [Priestia megaterium]